MHDAAVSYGINPVMSGVMMETKPAEETAQTLRKSPGGENGVVQSIGFKYKQSEKSQKPFAENGESQALSSGCHDSAVAIGFKAWQSADGGLGDEREVSPTLSHQPSALDPTLAQSQCDLSQMRYIVRRLTPTECERLMGLPDGYTIPTGLRRFFDADGEPSPELVAEFQRTFDTFNAIMADYAHKKPPKGKSYNQVADWLKKISNPETCPDSPRYKACGNGWATNQPRWILTRILSMDGIEW
jgi:site-specific DNA-cytosine methylase